MNYITYNIFKELRNEYSHIQCFMDEVNVDILNNKTFNIWTDNTYGIIVNIFSINSSLFAFEITITNQQKKLLFDLKYIQHEYY